jgi:hypothetical protein
MFNKLVAILLILVAIMGQTCKQIYQPEIDVAEKLLVVEGLLTDESNTITVRLSNTTPFQDQEISPEYGATVFVYDDIRQFFKLKEKAQGIYTDSTFHSEYGRIYTLVVKTRNNKFYRSSPQILFPKSVMESVNYVITEQTLHTTVNGKLLLKTLPGLEFTNIVKTDSLSSPYLRFSNTVLVEYSENIGDPALPAEETGFFYAWKKYKPNEFFNLNDTRLIGLAENIQTLAFCPIDSKFYNIIHEDLIGGYPPAIVGEIDRQIYYYGITTKKYHLNADVFQYYKAINDQLAARNRIYDPVSFQIHGNMTCDNNPEEPVLGVFEVSSTSMRTYSFSYFLSDNTLKFNEIKPTDLENIDENGKFRVGKFPSFWIYDY